MHQSAFKNKSRISITIMPSLNLILEKESEFSGISKSELVERAVEAFLKNKLNRDSKILGNIHFEDLPSENEWLMLGSKLEPYENN